MESEQDFIDVIPEEPPIPSDRWKTMYKIVPGTIPWKPYPEYKVGHLYQLKEEYGVRLCRRGFHASYTVLQAMEYRHFDSYCQCFEVLVRVVKEDPNKVVGDQLYVVKEVMTDKFNKFEYKMNDKDCVLYLSANGHRHCYEIVEGYLKPIIDQTGAQIWYSRNSIRRVEQDKNGVSLPAMISADGSKYWYGSGYLSRTEKYDGKEPIPHMKLGYTYPAVMESDGTLKWYTNGHLNRTDKDPDTGLIEPAVISSVIKEWYQRGEYSRTDRDKDGYLLPTIEINDGKHTIKKWHNRNILHRDEKDENNMILPAVVDSNGSMVWYSNGLIDRTDVDEQGKQLPAMICSDGVKKWYVRGKLSRDKDRNGRCLPAIESSEYCEWYENGYLSRSDKDENGMILPAVINADGTKMWYKYGKLTRTDKDKDGKMLPAVVYSDGNVEYVKNGVRIDVIV